VADSLTVHIIVSIEFEMVSWFYIIEEPLHEYIYIHIYKYNCKSVVHMTELKKIIVTKSSDGDFRFRFISSFCD
jgi:hypothetical protein